MLDLDLRSNRLEKDQQKRLDDAKKKRAKEIQQQREHARREQEMAERAAVKKAEMEKADMERILAEEDERRITGGISFLHNFKPYEIEGEDDKVILPEDCLTELTQQDAFGRSALTFQLSFERPSGNIITHCGVREFSAPAGTIGLPKKVIDSLDADISEISTVTIKFVLLSKCSFAKLQPKCNNFIEVGPVKMCLEDNLRFHTSLTVGDQLTVWYRGKAHVLCVTEMKPDSKGCLVDTDVEIDLELSQEFLRHQQETAPPSRTLGRGSPHGQSNQPINQPIIGLGGFASATGSSVGSAQASRDASPSVGSVFRALNESAVGAPVVASDNNRVVGAPNTTAHRKDIISEYAAQLLVEHFPQDKESVSIKIKFPNGSTKMRRFAHTTEIRQLFIYIALEMAQQQAVEAVPADLINRVQISTRFPARSLRYADVVIDTHNNNSKTFADLRMNVSSEAVFVTLV